MTSIKRSTRRMRAHQAWSSVILGVAVFVAVSSVGVQVARVGEGTVKPGRMTEAEREQIKAQNRLQERVGEEIGRMREAEVDSGALEESSFEELKQRALARLNIAAETLEPSGSEESEGQQRVCFDEGGNPTSDRSQCAMDQSVFFGIAEEGGGEGGEEFGYELPAENVMAQQMGSRFGYHGGGSPTDRGIDLGAIIDQALMQLEAVQPHVEEDEDMAADIEDAIAWLEEMQEEVEAGDITPEEERYYAEQIQRELQPLQRMMMSQHGGGGFDGGPDMSQMMDIMETMMGKLPKVIAIFEREGVPVPSESRTVADEVIATFRRLKGPCIKRDMDACLALGNAGGSLELKMRPPMEKSMMAAVASGKISFDRVQEIVMEIEAMMSEGMEGRMMSPSPGVRGALPGMGDDGMPEGFEDMMDQGFGPPPGYGGYGPGGYGDFDRSQWGR